MRKILFRGKCVDTGMWYEGGYIHLHKTTHCPIGDPERFPDNDIDQIVFERMTDWELPNQHLRVDVDPKTVGQFTGLTDKNGKKIFEGDICKVENLIYKVVFEYSCWWFKILSNKVYCCPAFNSRCGEYCEVIGNIYDNPELLEVDND